MNLGQADGYIGSMYMAVLITLLIGLMGILMGTDDINEDDAGP